jgi:hypothetical protein
MKKGVSVILLLVLLFTLTTTAFAADEPSEAAPPNVYGMDFTYIVFATGSLDITSSGVASCEASMLCSSSIDQIRISSYLQKYDGGWVTVKHWTQDTYSNSATFERSQSVVSGYAYRHSCYYYAYINGSLVESTSMTTYDSY